MTRTSTYGNSFGRTGIHLFSVLLLLVLSTRVIAQQSDTVKYEYDRLNRVTKVTYLSSGASIIYTYDAAGNRTAVQVIGSNLLPVLTSLNTTSVPAGTHGFTLVINGNNMINGASVQLNNSARTTTYFNGSVTVDFTDADLATSRDITITVVNPDGGTSNPLTFKVTEATTFSISGRITAGGGNLSGVALTLSGSKSTSTQTDSNGNYSFTNLVNGTYTVTPSKTAFSFSPLNQSFANLSASQTADFTASLIPQSPILVSEENSTRAVALDSVTSLRDPFQNVSPVAWGTDGRTRVSVFAMNFSLNAGETASVVTADAEDAAHRIYPLVVETVTPVPNQPWLTAINLRLNNDMGDLGDVLVRITARGIPSNRVRLGIGRIGGGPADDQGAVPTPGRQP